MTGAPVTVAVPRTGAGGSDHLLWVVRSEWTKLWSVRSTVWTLLVTVAVTVGVSVLACWAVSSERGGRPAGPLDVTGVTLAGLSLGQLAMAVLGVLVITGEFGTGSIRTSLAAVPGRLRLLTAKAVVLTAVGLATGVLACFPSFFLGMAFFDARGEGVGLADPGVLRAVVGGALLLTACGLLGFAVGAILRHTAGAVAVTVGLLFVIPIVLVAVPVDALQSVNRYFLASAGDDVTSVIRQPDSLAPWTGYLVFLAEIAVLLVVGGVLMRRRDV